MNDDDFDYSYWGGDDGLEYDGHDYGPRDPTPSEEDGYGQYGGDVALKNYDHHYNNMKDNLNELKRYANMDFDAESLAEDGGEGRESNNSITFDKLSLEEPVEMDETPSDSTFEDLFNNMTLLEDKISTKRELEAHEELERNMEMLDAQLDNKCENDLYNATGQQAKLEFEEPDEQAINDDDDAGDDEEDYEYSDHEDVEQEEGDVKASPNPLDDLETIKESVEELKEYLRQEAEAMEINK